jgi:hypothetical protein
MLLEAKINVPSTQHAASMMLSAEMEALTRQKFVNHQEAMASMTLPAPTMTLQDMMAEWWAVRQGAPN